MRRSVVGWNAAFMRQNGVPEETCPAPQEVSAQKIFWRASSGLVSWRFNFLQNKIMEPKADIAVIGLAVMGQNLILNMNDHNYTVVAYNRTVSKVDDFLGNEAKGTNVIGAHSIEEMVQLLKRPRRIMLMVKAGQPV